MTIALCHLGARLDLLKTSQPVALPAVMSSRTAWT